jgi:hypothetical protein
VILLYIIGTAACRTGGDDILSIDEEAIFDWFPLSLDLSRKGKEKENTFGPHI